MHFLWIKGNVKSYVMNYLKECECFFCCAISRTLCCEAYKYAKFFYIVLTLHAKSAITWVKVPKTNKEPKVNKGTKKYKALNSVEALERK